jgi:hypothetical protein
VNVRLSTHGFHKASSRATGFQSLAEIADLETGSFVGPTDPGEPVQRKKQGSLN